MRCGRRLNARQQHFALAHQQNHVALVETKDRGRNDLAKFRIEFFVGLLTLGIAQFLHNDLPCALSCDATQGRGGNFNLHFLANLRSGVRLLSFAK